MRTFLLGALSALILSGCADDPRPSDTIQLSLEGDWKSNCTRFGNSRLNNLRKPGRIIVLSIASTHLSVLQTHYADAGCKKAIATLLTLCEHNGKSTARFKECSTNRFKIHAPNAVKLVTELHPLGKFENKPLDEWFVEFGDTIQGVIISGTNFSINQPIPEGHHFIFKQSQQNTLVTRGRNTGFIDGEINFIRIGEAP